MKEFVRWFNMGFDLKYIYNNDIDLACKISEKTYLFILRNFSKWLRSKIDLILNILLSSILLFSIIYNRFSVAIIKYTTAVNDINIDKNPS